ncbi:MAG: VWA domain-containing protein [Bacteroidales bacterium]|nr:VWA domain-containing protein [Bacteroidales bacterium]
MKKEIRILLLVAVSALMLLPACTTKYIVIEKSREEVPSSVIRAKFRVEKKTPIRRVLFFMPAQPAAWLTEENFSRKENGEFIETESQLNVQTNPQSFQIYTVLLLDNSLSIGENLPKLREAAIKLVNMKRNNQNYAIAVFSGEEDLNLITDFTKDTRTLINAINSIEELGNNTTNLYGAILNALEHLEKKEATVDKEIMTSYQIIVFTDGADRANIITIDQVLEKQKSTGYDIYPIVVQSLELDLKKIQQISTTKDVFGKGKYYKANSYDKLGSSFEEIQRDLVEYANSHYYLEYMSPKRGKNFNYYEIRIEPKFVVFKYMNRLGDKMYHYNNKIIDDFDSEPFYSVKQGICVTANNDFKQSEKIYKSDTIYFTQGKSQKIYLFSVGGTSPQAKYEKPILNNDNFTFKKIDDNLEIYDWLIITPKGKKGSESKLTIKDSQNNFQKTVILKINKK